MNIQQFLATAVAHHRAGSLAKAEGIYRRILAHTPEEPNALQLLGALASQSGRPALAVDLITRALRRLPENASCHTNLGEAYRALGQPDKARSHLQQAIAIRPDYPEPHNNLGNVLHGQGQLDEAIACFRQALTLQPDYADAHNNLGNVLKDQGLIDDAIASYRRAMASKPDFVGAHSNLLFAMQYSPCHDSQQLLEESRRWNASHAEPLRRLARSHKHEPDGERRLRIGYVSPDFCKHCQSLFTIPLLSHHDHRQFEIHCYSGVGRPDDLTERLRGYADVWRTTGGLTDLQIANLIRSDAIDILVDLTMHMAHGRPLIFALKPAPIQVAWLAYPGTTGISTMDYRLTDGYLDPPEQQDNCYTEQSIRLADTFWCYDPLTAGLPVGPLPAETAGHVTFGSLNNFCKVNVGVLALWSRVLSAVPDSRLLLLGHEGSHRRVILEALRGHGVGAERIDWFTPAARRTYLEAYHRIDIGLDTFPYNGHTTSLDSFWMGVPVLTLLGQTVVGRAGLSQAMNLGLPELVARSPDEYVQAAVDLARDLPRLSALRAGLRPRLQASPLMDAPRFARNVEAAYRHLWHTWCQLPGT